jgi:hypothetical protein
MGSNDRETVIIIVVHKNSEFIDHPSKKKQQKTNSVA